MINMLFMLILSGDAIMLRLRCRHPAFLKPSLELETTASNARIGQHNGESTNLRLVQDCQQAEIRDGPRGGSAWIILLLQVDRC